MKNWKILGAAITVMLVLGMAGSADKEEAQRAEDQYCADVAAGVYDRDWKGLCAPEEVQK